MNQIAIGLVVWLLTLSVCVALGWVHGIEVFQRGKEAGSVWLMGTFLGMVAGFVAAAVAEIIGTPHA